VPGASRATPRERTLQLFRRAVIARRIPGARLTRRLTKTHHGATAAEYGSGWAPTKPDTTRSCGEARSPQHC
jgi:hypothetical protein